MRVLDFLFPPLCLFCRERTPLPFFCSTCWELCSPIDPVGRCQECFSEAEADRCWTCQRRSRHLPFLRGVVFESTGPARYLCRDKGEALAGFFFYQWVQLEWEMPDVVFPMPGMKPVAKAFVELFNRSSDEEQVSYAEMSHVDLLEEGKIVLILDEKSSLPTLRKMGWALSRAFPKRIFQLSLMEHDLFTAH